MVKDLTSLKGKIEIVDSNLMYSPHADRVGQQDFAFIYNVGGSRRYEILIPANELEGKSQEAQNAIILDYIEKDQKRHRQFMGRKL